MKQENNLETIKHLEKIRDDRIEQEKERERLERKTAAERAEVREKQVEIIKNNKREMEKEIRLLDGRISKSHDDLDVIKIKLAELKPKRDAVMEQLQAQTELVRNTDVRVYQLEEILNESLDYLNMLVQRRELILTYLEIVRDFVMGLQVSVSSLIQIPVYIQEIFNFFRQKPYYEEYESYY